MSIHVLLIALALWVFGASALAALLGQMIKEGES